MPYIFRSPKFYCIKNGTQYGWGKKWNDIYNQLQKTDFFDELMIKNLNGEFSENYI